MSLTELLIRHACGLPIPSLARERSAVGVMMLPIPGAGFLQRVEGLDAARSIPGIVDIVITATATEYLRPLPEGASYPGFVFARGATPQEIEQALRLAHDQLHLVITPSLTLV